jgi:DNA-binding MarR family transcriptional regulator
LQGRHYADPVQHPEHAESPSEINNDSTGRRARDGPTLVRILKPLLRDGLVVAPAEERVKRRFRLTLTEKGRERFEQATVHWRAAQANFEVVFGQQQAVHLRNELFRVTRDVPNA